MDIISPSLLPKSIADNIRTVNVHALVAHSGCPIHTALCQYKASRIARIVSNFLGGLGVRAVCTCCPLCHSLYSYDFANNPKPHSPYPGFVPQVVHTYSCRLCGQKIFMRQDMYMGQVRARGFVVGCGR